MKKACITLPEIKIVGIPIQTNNTTEMNPPRAKVDSLIHRYFNEKVASHISHRVHPGKLYAVYTHYMNDKNGNYSYLIGEEVSEFKNISVGFVTFIIPAQMYIVYTSEQGERAEVCQRLWKKIRGMTSQELGGERSYRTDFELYDERAADPVNTILDIAVGVRT